MADSKAQAVELKNQGNKAFAAHDWPTAIDFYTKAIELDESQPTYFSNRAQVWSHSSQPRLVTASSRTRVTDYLQANIKSEAYGYAIEDATKAIALDPNFVKVF